MDTLRLPLGVSQDLSLGKRYHFWTVTQKQNGTSNASPSPEIDLEFPLSGDTHDVQTVTQDVDTWRNPSFALVLGIPKRRARPGLCESGDNSTHLHGCNKAGSVLPRPRLPGFV